jgi:putative ABC transport system substrate-binding protein
VIVAVADPVRVGLVTSLARPGGNVTGLSLLTPELSGRRLQMIAEMLPQLTRVGVLANPGNLSSAIFLDETMDAAQKMGAQIQPFHARNPDQTGQAFEAATRNNMQGLIVFDDPMIWSHRKQVVALAAKTRLPVMYGYNEFVSDGGLISYGPYRPDMYRRTAVYVDKILRGAKPADLAVERPTKFELHVNVPAAKALALTIPQSILVQADRVIE